MNRWKFLLMLGWSAAMLVAGVGQSLAQLMLTPGVDYTKPNFAYSPPLTKFVDSLPGLTPAGANGIGQYLPVAVANTPYGSPYGTNCQYYEIALVEYTEQMHQDLKDPVSAAPQHTKLRGYVQLVPSTYAGAVALTTANGLTANIVDPVSSVQLYGIDKPHYMGPLILATKDVPVRIKFRNLLPTGTAGNLFLPVDTMIMGAGIGPLGMNVPGGMQINFTQNRGTLHLHGGVPPWISDGTTHQWTAPYGDNTPYTKGASARDVSDMPATIDGDMTFYWTNQQGGRFMFYHDHAWGITGPDVYAGEAAGYLLTDPVEDTALAAAGVPGTIITDTNTGNVVSADLAHLLPLVIQDKSFVPDPVTLAATDPLWDTLNWGGMGNLWYPHVYSPNQWPANPDQSGANPFGRWDYGPWFWPPWLVTVPYPPIVCHVPESFMDTTMVNGQPYPYVNVQPTKYRLRILNACNDRMLNLQMYQASAGIISNIAVTVAGLGYDPLNPPFVTITPAVPGNGVGAAATAIVDPISGAITGISLDIVGSGYTLPPTITVAPPPAGGVQAAAIATVYTVPTEVGMVPASLASGITFPAAWQVQTPFYTPDILDNRAGGVPDPAMRGPAMVQIGTEGGLLPEPVVHHNTPVGYEQNKRNIVVLNVSRKTLFMAAAERADVIVDFSNFAGKTVILYNDSPAPVPAADSRNDFYTGDLDQTAYGGSPTTPPGKGPNTRTILQFRVAGTGGTAPTDDYDTNLVANLQNPATGLPAIFKATQPMPIVPQTAYNAVGYGTVASDTVARIQDTSLTYTPYGAATPVTNSMLSKTIQELFDDVGRMNAILGVELPFTNGRIQTTVPLAFVDPVTELYNDGEMQIWKITHNGVDTHGVHFHLYNVQVINRVGWDGAIMPPDPNEMGWKDTVRMHPLQDIIVAARAISPKVPFGVPECIRPLNPAEPIGSLMGFSNLDPLTGNAFAPPTTNAISNFNWEYTWHCHLLGHEENDMMRPMSLVVTSTVPVAPVLSAAGSGPVMLSWTDATPANDPATPGNPANEIGFRIERALVTGDVPGPYTAIATNPANTTTFVDTTAISTFVYAYRVVAFNAAGEAMSNVIGLTVSQLMILTFALPNGEVTVPYTQPVVATGGVMPIMWSITVGALPAGLSINPATGLISGHPTVAGTSNFTVVVTDANSVTATQALSVAVIPLPTITTTALPTGEVTVAYNQLLIVSGGLPPFAWSVTAGALPGGLNLNPATGAISGTPLVAGTFNFTVQVQDANAVTAAQALSMVVLAVPTITTTALPNGEVTVPYSQPVVVSGGLPPIMWSVTAGALPGGLALNAATGVISGTPTAAGTFNFTVQARDANALTTVQALSIVVLAVPTITTTALVNGEVTVPYSQSVIVSGGLAPIAWSVTVGALPGGLSLNAATGVISGTPTAAGTFNFTVQAQDANTVTAVQALSIVVVPVPAIVTTALPNGEVRLAYNQPLAITGGTAPFAWSVTVGALPGGLSLNAATGVISGTPTASGTFNFTVQAQDANAVAAAQALSIVVITAPAISTASLANGEISVPYSQTLTASGGLLAYTWSIASGALPAGVGLNAASGLISGTPTASGTFNITAQVQDANGVTDTKALSIIVAPLPVVTTVSLANADRNTAYSQTLTATGGTTPYAWSLTAGTLPAGLTLNAASGVIGGTPTTLGTSTFTVQVRDANNVTAAQTLSITVVALPTVATTSLPNGEVGVAYNRSLAVSGGVAPYSWSISAGALPAGLTLSSALGAISGVPTTAGTYNFTVRVADSLGRTATRNLSIVVRAAVRITTVSLANTTLGSAYGVTLAATGGATPYVWSLASGALPNGLTLSTGGRISGRSTVRGTFNFTVQVNDAPGGIATKPFAITVR